MDNNTSAFEIELTKLINRHCKENGSNTPDYLLAMYLNSCLVNFNKIVKAREAWYGREFKDYNKGTIIQQENEFIKQFPDET